MPHDEIAVLLDADGRAVVGESFDVQVRAAGSILRANALRGRRALLSITSSPPETCQVGSIDSEWRSALELLAAAEPTGKDALARFLERDASPALHAVELVATAALEPQLVDALLDRALLAAGLARARRRGELNGGEPFRCVSLRSCGSGGGPVVSLQGATTRREASGLEEARAPVVKTATFSLLLGLLFAWNWGRLESGRSAGEIALMILLGVAPALLPSLRLRLAGAGVALIAAWSIALDVRPYALGTVLERTGRGFLDFYDVLVPFSAWSATDGRRRPPAIFTFTALASLAIARAVRSSRPRARGRSGLAVDDLPRAMTTGRGVLLLLAALARRPPRADDARGAQQVLVATTLVVTALIASSWNGVAKAQFLDWQKWDLSTKAGHSVNVEYVWNANYRGVNFPKKRTRVFTVKTDNQRAVYWRATTLDTFVDNAWREELLPTEAFRPRDGSRDLLTNDPLLPKSARDPTKWTQATVHVDALRDSHVIGPSGSVAYAGDSLDGISYYRGGVADVPQPLTRGTEYNAGRSSPRPTPSKPRSRRLFGN
jgi:hypothetical protein